MRLVSNTWVLFRALKVIFVKIRLPKQVSADGESSGGLREFKSPVKFPISFFFFFFSQSKDFCCEAVHCPRLKIIFHHKDAKVDNMSIFFLKIDEGFFLFFLFIDISKVFKKVTQLSPFHVRWWHSISMANFHVNIFNLVTNLNLF